MKCWWGYGGNGAFIHGGNVNGTVTLKSSLSVS